MRQRGFTHILILVIVLLLATIAGAYYLGTQKNQLTSVVQSSPTPETSLDTTDWKTYTSEKFGYQIKHPNLLLNQCNVGGMEQTDTLDVVLSQGQPMQGTGYCGTYTISIFTDSQTKKSVSKKLGEFVSLQTEKEGMYGGKKEDYMQTNTTVGNISATKLTSKTNSSFAIYAFSKGSALYYILINDADEESQVLDQILSTFRFAK